MTKQTNNPNRQREIIDICLNQFLEDGLFKTSTRDLANTLNMQPSGLYYYFKSKDEIVVACAEEAGIRLEDTLILPLLDCLEDREQYMETAGTRIEEARPMMQFFAQVCTTNEYRVQMQPVMERLKERHQAYSHMLAKRLSCESEEVAPYLYACVAVVANYMIFGEEFYYEKPYQLLAGAMRDFKNRKEMAQITI